MQEEFDVFLDNRRVGTVQLKREGLYVALSCRCAGLDEAIWRLYRGEQRIGVLAPAEGGMELITRINAKRLGENPVFSVRSERAGQGGYFLPIEPDKPFPGLSRLREARLAVRGGQMGALLPEKEKSSMPFREFGE